MTNNPTIDGVSPPINCRQRMAAEGKPYPRSSCEVCGQFSPKWRECDALLDADKVSNRQMGLMQFVEAHPITTAVERQSDPDCEWCGGCGHDHYGDPCTGCAQSEVAALQSTNKRLTETIQRMIDQTIPLVPDENNPMWTRRITIDELQSTIARLEAQLNNAINLDFQRRERITQLESEAEFAAATYQAARDRIAELTHISEDFLKLADTPSDLPLGFGADLLKRIRACLDATAALNGPDK